MQSRLYLYARHISSDIIGNAFVSNGCGDGIKIYSRNLKIVSMTGLTKAKRIAYPPALLRASAAAQFKIHAVSVSMLLPHSQSGGNGELNLRIQTKETNVCSTFKAIPSF